jgi:hypothetical protein
MKPVCLLPSPICANREIIFSFSRRLPQFDRETAVYRLADKHPPSPSAAAAAQGPDTRDIKRARDQLADLSVRLVCLSATHCSSRRLSSAAAASAAESTPPLAWSEVAAPTRCWATPLPSPLLLLLLPWPSVCMPPTSAAALCTAACPRAASRQPPRPQPPHHIRERQATGKVGGGRVS